MAWIAPVAMGIAQLASNWFGQRKQNRENRKLAEYQNTANKEFLNQQLEYNAPKMQMSRYQEAGLNPNLVYGQGNPGNQSAPQQAADMKPADYQGLLRDVVPAYNQSALMQAQVQATNAKTDQIGVLANLQRLQASVVAANPLLNTEGFNAIIESLKATAVSKSAGSVVDKMKSEWFSGQKSFHVGDTPMHGPAGAIKMEAELKLLLQKYDLGAKDQQIKSEVLNGKEFQNDLLEIQKKWMVDWEVTPQHIYQFIQLFLMSLLKR